MRGHWSSDIPGLVAVYRLHIEEEIHEDDLAEKKNIAKENPAVVKKLRGLLAEFRKDLEENSRPVGLAKLEHGR